MVAIHVPGAQERWGAAPVDAPAARPPLRPVPRPLPDRATRVRRRRLAVLAAAAAVALALPSGLRAVGGLVDVGSDGEPRPLDGGAEVTDGGGSVPQPGERYVVRPGDTLWGIAAEIAPDRDPREVVEALRDANGGPELQVGTELVLDID
ncbi:MAG TPA: LysM peptidoglycan-binding domain-containing protein [Acidimicrobiales bacterium]|nr:LysM peptidoglycan-binding domain-containing protein [Acidimicrobiales bacterium]